MTARHRQMYRISLVLCFRLKVFGFIFLFCCSCLAALSFLRVLANFRKAVLLWCNQFLVVVYHTGHISRVFHDRLKEQDKDSSCE